ncbi:hypothetical protein BD324DRAFT_613947 [Kockovaella imperatae]|uniref:Uncharacterized protein n=1 Tax=Kockovaella imperatae TaxID=4999 RepID=A0A1Y1UUN1_9TREE|nr:hypothetical protein BD324DRAFT_613947 [Kockovaella imperatae]ORX41284.1 hypothetical protein BD324DRAFT_613947 [Kockovaella imperatae]
MSVNRPPYMLRLPQHPFVLHHFEVLACLPPSLRSGIRMLSTDQSLIALYVYLAVQFRVTFT